VTLVLRACLCFFVAELLSVEILLLLVCPLYQVLVHGTNGTFDNFPQRFMILLKVLGLTTPHPNVCVYLVLIVFLFLKLHVYRDQCYYVGKLTYS
jgi:hypothetical protein